MKTEVSGKKLRRAGLGLYSVLAVLTAFTPSCSKEKKDVSLSVSEPTELEKNSEIGGLLEKTKGVYPVYGSDKNLVSATIIGKVPIRAKHSRAGLQASQQAAIWSACAEFVSFLKINTTLQKNDSSQASLKSNPTEEESSSDADGKLSGVHVVVLHTDVQKQEVAAILRWKAPPWKTETGILPKMTVVTSQSSASEQIASPDDKSKGISNELNSRIYVNGVLVISEIIRTFTDNNGAEESTVSYKQFFENGKPHLEETVEGKQSSVKIRGTMWDETGNKAKYQE